MAAPPPPPGNAAAGSSSGTGINGVAPADRQSTGDKGKERELEHANGNGSADAAAGIDAKREAEFKKRDKTLGEFMVMLDEYKPLIPDEVTDYYLQKSGFECDDPRLRNLLALATQKFIADIATDAFHYAKLRNNITGVSTASGAGAGGGASGAGAAGGTGGRSGAGGKGDKATDKNRVVLTMDDLSLALGDHGIKNKRPDYYF